MTFKTVALSYVYADPSAWPKYEKAIDVCGWRKSVILTQIAQTFGKVNLPYYQKAAEIDAKARGFSEHKGKHFELLSSWGDLPPYTGDRPIYGHSPIEHIPDPASGLKRESFGQFRCSARNSAILRLCLETERTNINVLMSRLMVWYYAKYWPLYLPQIASAEQETLSPELSS